MQITNTLNRSILTNRYNYEQSFSNRKNMVSENSESSFSDAVTKAETEEEGKFLNLTTVDNESHTMGHVMFAMLPKTSTPENPIVQIITGASGKREVYNIEINKVNPQNATQMEIFALCCYADETGKGTGDPYGSYCTVTTAISQAKCNNYTGKMNEDPPTWEQFANERIDWTELVDFFVGTLKNNKDIKMMELLLEGNKLLNFFTEHIKIVNSACD